MRYKVFISAIAFSLLSTASYARISDADMVKDIEKCLSQGSATTVCEYPEEWRNLNEPLRVARNITWNTPTTLQLISKEDIIFENDAFIKSEGAGSLLLKAGMENKNNGDYKNAPQGKIVFKDEVVPHISINEGAVKFYYNPEKGAPGEWNAKNKYWNSLSHFYEQRVTFQSEKGIISYMLVNHVRDLQDIRKALYNNYALSQDIDASETEAWEEGKGFRPLKAPKGERGQPFSGDFDGNGYTISNLYINRPDEDKVGLFGMSSGSQFHHNSIKNTNLKNIHVIGRQYVGGLVGWITNSNIERVSLAMSTVEGRYIVGGIIGTSAGIIASKISADAETPIQAEQYSGSLFGTADDSVFFLYGIEIPCVPPKDKDKLYYKSTIGYFTPLTTIYFPDASTIIDPRRSQEVPHEI